MAVAGSAVSYVKTKRDGGEEGRARSAEWTTFSILVSAG